MCQAREVVGVQSQAQVHKYYPCELSLGSPLWGLRPVKAAWPRAVTDHSASMARGTPPCLDRMAPDTAHQTWSHQLEVAF
jgi:hypothetical protein